MNWTRLLLLLALCSCLQCSSGTDVHVVSKPRTASQVGDQFGYAACIVNDVDGDERADWAASDPTGPGVVEMHSGATGNLLWSRKAPEADMAWGTRLVDVGDVDQDGKRDLAVGSSAGRQDASKHSSVTFLSGKDGTVIGALNERPVGSNGVSAMASIRDVDSDGEPDLVVCDLTSVSGQQQGCIEVWSVGKRSRLWAAHGTEGAWIGLQIDASGDLNHDRNADIVTIAHSSSRDRQAILLYSGADGTLLRRWTNPNTELELEAIGVMSSRQGTPMIIAVLAPPEHHTRAIPEIVAFDFEQEPPLWVIDCKDLTGHNDLVLELRCDLDGDGAKDIVVASRQYDLFAGRVVAFDGLQRSRMWVLDGEPDSDLGNCLYGGYDIDGDGKHDLLAGATSPFSREHLGHVSVISGAGREVYRAHRK